MIPNSKGMGIMVSEIQYSEFGFGFRHITDDEFRAINNRCCRSRNYADSYVSIKVDENIKNKIV